MPSRIVLQTVPNQSFSTLQDGVSYKIQLQETRGVMSATISIDDTPILSGARFFANAPLIPYEYLEDEGGNFLMTTEADAIPAWAEFEVTQFLFYLTASEVADIRS